KCLEIAGRLTSWGSASSLTVASPAASSSRMARRIGWANAAKMASRSRLTAVWLTIWLMDMPEGYLTIWLSDGSTRPGDLEGALYVQCAMISRLPTAHVVEGRVAGQRISPFKMAAASSGTTGLM